MATRINADVLQEDKTSLEGLKGITAYAPVRTEFATALVTEKSEAMIAAQAAETQAKNAHDAARDAAAAAEQAFHDMILGAKQQIIGQFGPDSNEAAALGLKKKSDRKPPQRKTGKTS
jgi:hypothetical protein